jgi:heptosyltransferase I
LRWLHQVPLFAPANRPRDICILRLSAIGDTCHTVPVIRALRSAWPECRITWIIGRAESKLMSLVPDVELCPSISAAS